MAGMMPGENTPQKAPQSLPQGRECPTLEPSTNCTPCQVLMISCCSFHAWVSLVHKASAEHVPTPNFLQPQSPAALAIEFVVLLLCALNTQEYSVVMDILLRSNRHLLVQAADLCTCWFSEGMPCATPNGAQDSKTHEASPWTYRHALSKCLAKIISMCRGIKFCQTGMRCVPNVYPISRICRSEQHMYMHV